MKKEGLTQDQVVLSGFGGQGIILAGYILGQAVAIYEGKNATFTQDYGPEARGGACRAQVVISDSEISYPYVENPSALIAMSQDAYAKYTRGIGRETIVLIDEELVKPGKTRNPTYAIPATCIAREMGRVGVANIVMLGFLAAITHAASPEAMKKSILDSVPKGTEQLNLSAFDRGFACGLERMKAG